ncbi:anhydro-N-acetylmuramic acid kinase [Exilibacterium tricleocarpae]|uniref:Anhydro-N-acetylmuramic acid kinase n=1 Tax=Exilibacterium tricleocarpae TaxID=2591008 RepID=A0A545T3A4_9GAMM|nr:anhydro-N-acetylmuramic acid kinase [Exilibacterium tricleocarpae]TQV71703.1 anhydro-N-acetylmuramic acid kinase [Exilibacterium tricleocarpae]
MDGQELYIGLMSGTSADGVDAALVDFAQSPPQLLAHHSHSMEAGVKQRIHRLATPADNEIDRLGVLDRELGAIFAAATLALLDKAQLEPGDIAAVGSHGQTVRHRPPHTTELPFSLQIGDPNDIAARTGITTVADFRRRDIAAGGQGAPLAPAFHRAVFQSPDNDRMIVNIGGMANVTYLPATGVARGFDTGPGNALMDAWILQHRGEAFDQNGRWAATGAVDPTLLAKLSEHPFFHQSGPKSTGREAFNEGWLQRVLAAINRPLAAADVQATLLELTAGSIAGGIKSLREDRRCEVFICGGGAHNQQLLLRLQKLLQPTPVASTDALGIAPDWVEAAAFAWLARQTMGRLKGNLATVTGADKEVILGGVYFGDPAD